MRINYILFVIILIYSISYVQAKNTVRIKNKDLINIENTVRQYQNQEIIFYFPDKEYDFSVLSSTTLNFIISSNITFYNYNKNKTIFNFKNKEFKGININFKNNGKLRFYNILFKNYSTNSKELYLIKSFYNEINTNYHLVFEDCIFEDISSNLYLSVSRCLKITQNEPHTLFYNCQFINNNSKIMHTYNEVDDPKDEASLCNIVEYSNCFFTSSNNLFKLNNVNLKINNSSFENISSISNTDSSIIESKSKSNKIEINNSIFKNSNNDIGVPFMHFIENSILIQNVTFSKCFTNFGFLISVNKSTNKNKLIIDNSVFDDVSSIITGNSNDIEYKNSELKNINSKKSTNPPHNNCKSTSFRIINSTFKNISIGTSLIGSESIYNITNVNLNNISTNGNAVIDLMYNTHYFNNVTITNIVNNGDAGEASFISFESREENQKLILKNISIDNGKSNGPFIKIKGNSNVIDIEDSNISNVKSYGAIIKNVSKKSKVVMRRVNFYENENLDKSQCGAIHFENSLDLSISNSVFLNNTSKSNGGAICMKNLNDLNLSIESSRYISNAAVNGGALYLDKTLINNNFQSNIKLTNVTFQSNIAYDYGGALYSDYDKLYVAEIQDVNFNKNIANIAGGAIFVPNEYNKKSLDISKCNFVNNIGETHGNDFTTEVSYIKLSNTDINTIIKSGDYIPLKFSLYDEYGKFIFDKFNIYSGISLSINIQNNDTPKYEIRENKCTFFMGICDFSQFRLFAHPSNYTLNIECENHYNNAIFQIDSIDVKVNTCNRNQIQYQKNDILYCENPICNNKCNLKSGECIPINHYTTENTIETNICQCFDGYEGIFCEIKSMINLEDKRVINDTGYYKHLFYSFGILLIFLSSMFGDYKNYIYCTLNFFSYHNGFLIIYFVSTIHLQLNLALGANPLPNPNNNYNDYSSSEEDDVSNEIVIMNNNNEDQMIAKENTRNISSRKLNITIRTKNINKLYKNIKTINALYSKLYIYYLFINIFMIVIIIIQAFNEKYNKINDDEKYIIDESKKFRYNCPLIQYDNGLNIIEIIVFIQLVAKSKKVWNYECIFKIIQYINYSIPIWITTGPIAKLIFNFFLQNNLKSKLLMVSIFNIICYLSLYYLYMRNIIYTVIKKQSNNTKFFFKYPSPNFCFEHKEYDCNCYITNKVCIDTEFQINICINEYKYCSKIFEISNGKIKFVSDIKKFSHKNLI
ncbi:hypothetical protein U3516DRAFT_643530 [Neocallimastix sp. 'constans']